MNNAYNIDLKSISLDYFKEILQKRELVPSRRILKEDIEENFRKLAGAEIQNLKDLITNINSPKKITAFSKASGLSEQYLKILKREAASYTPKPINLSAFPEINPEIIKKLEEMGIKNSKHLFDSVHEDLKKIEGIGELICLSDLVRLYGVGPVFAKMVYKTGIKSIKDFSKYTGEDFIKLYEKETNKKADFSIGDINFSLELAHLMS